MIVQYNADDWENPVVFIDKYCDVHKQWVLCSHMYCIGLEDKNMHCNSCAQNNKEDDHE